MPSLKRSCIVAALATVAVVSLAAAPVAQAKVAYHETFASLDGWVQSKHRPAEEYGKIALAHGPHVVDAKAQTGLKLTEDARFYAVSKQLPTPIENAGKDVVVSFSAQNGQDWNCAGSYLKFLPEVDQADFNGDSPYWLMFGPDRCGYKGRIHIIFHYKGENLLWKKTPDPAHDQLTHVHTLRVSPDLTYAYYLDGEQKEAGRLDEDWDFLPPKTIADPADKKPEDWVDAARIADPTDTKPSDWDDVPAVIEDTTATKPDDWNDEEDGEWTAPEIPNPKYKGKWTPRMVENSAYKGPWVQKQIANPDYKENPELYKIVKPVKYVGIDVWQVQSGTVFNDIIIGDNLDEVLALVKSTYGAIAETEKALREKQRQKEEAELEISKDMIGETAGDDEDDQDL